MGISGRRVLGEARSLAELLLGSFEGAAEDLARATSEDVSDLAEKIRRGVEKRARVVSG